MPSNKPSRTVLIELPERVVVFLRAVGGHAGIRAAMADGGYSEADHEEGCALLVAVCAYGRNRFDPKGSEAARQSVTEIETWMRTHRRRLEAAIARLHPEAVGLFEGLDGADRPDSTIALATLVARVDALPRVADAVRRTLERRGFGEEERGALMRTIESARSFTFSDGDGVPREDRSAELERLYHWHSDWAATARALIRRRDYLKMLGLTRRRRAGSPQTA